MAGETGATTSRILNRLQYALPNKAAAGTTLATGDLIPVADLSADYKIVGSTPAELYAAMVAGGFLNAPITIADATPYAVLAANSGKVHIIAEQTNSITINLPVLTAGMNYKFIMGGVAVEAQNWVFVATTPSFLTGGILWGDLNAGAASDELGPLYCNGSSHLTLTYVTPGAGSWLEVYSNGTKWFVNGQVISDSTPTIA